MTGVPAGQLVHAVAPDPALYVPGYQFIIMMLKYIFYSQSPYRLDTSGKMYTPWMRCKFLLRTTLMQRNELHYLNPLIWSNLVDSWNSSTGQ